MRRTPLQTLLVAAAIAAGAIIGTRLIAGRVAATAPAGPDIRVEHADLDGLAAAGYRFGARRPRSWSDISLRQYADQRGEVLVLRARMAADEAAELVTFPADARRPLADAPPPDWPRDADAFALPAWFRPQGAQSRCYERATASGSEGRFAVYDPADGVLQAWMWRRRDVHLARPAPAWAVADEIASAVADRLLRDSDAAAPDWLTATALPAAELFADGRLPAERVDAALAPTRDTHRYLLALRGIGREQALAIAGAHMPLRPLAADGAPPEWAFARPPRGLPPWFAPGPGDRWAHALVGIGTGAVSAARWAAYDEAARTLYLWDWADAAGRPAATDPTAGR